MDSDVGAGSFLIAGPNLTDPNFRRTVVLLCEHSAEGSLGLVINRPLDAPLEKVFPHLARDERPLGNVFSGGPVENTRMLALRLAVDADPGGDESTWGEQPRVIGGVHMVTDVESALDAIANGLADPDDHRFYLGYAGWGGGQLDRELTEDAWILRPAESRFIFTARPDQIWTEVLREMGGIHRLYAEMPMDPGMN